MKWLIYVWLVLSIASARAEIDYRVEPIVESLPSSVAMALLPDGDVLLAQRAALLRRVHDGALMNDAVAGIEALAVPGRPLLEMLDLALHPQFDTNRWLYMAYVTGEPRDAPIAFGDSEVRIARARYVVDADGRARLEQVERLFATPTRHARPVHYAGRLAFLHDGTLLLTSGDRSVLREQAQQLDSPVGKTLRLRDDGSVPDDNPFAVRGPFAPGGPVATHANAYPYVWTLGHRNAQGLLVDRVTGAVYASEHGPQGGDELNRLRSGANYGWPVATHGIDYSGGLITPFDVYAGTEQPLLHWEPSIAPSGLAQCRSCRWPAWEEDVLLGALAGKQVRRVQIDDGRIVGQQILFAELKERIRDVRFAADGTLWLLTDHRESSARLLRVLPADHP